MRRVLQGLLVGAHFRPPAKLILASLPSGAELILEPEPDNPYDEAAVKVLCRPSAIPEGQFLGLDEGLPASGFSLDEVLRQESVWLGYLGASKNKDVVKGGFASNVEILALMANPGHLVSLAFAPDGKALVQVVAEIELPAEQRFSSPPEEQ